MELQIIFEDGNSLKRFKVNTYNKVTKLEKQKCLSKIIKNHIIKIL